MLQIDIITLFPDYFTQVLAASIPARAAREGLVSYRTVNLRDFAVDKHGAVDDYPFGGGAGMVLRPEPLFDAVQWCRQTKESENKGDQARVILFSARGEPLDQRRCERYSLCSRLILICGHYKDVDERGAQHLVVLIDAVVRLLPGALGDFDSALGDSFSDGLLGPPHYTRPREYRGWKVPAVLLSGDHEKISRWRQEQAEKLTRQRRPDLLE